MDDEVLNALSYMMHASSDGCEGRDLNIGVLYDELSVAMSAATNKHAFIGRIHTLEKFRSSGMSRYDRMWRSSSSGIDKSVLIPRVAGVSIMMLGLRGLENIGLYVSL